MQKSFQLKLINAISHERLTPLNMIINLNQVVVREVAHLIRT